MGTGMCGDLCKEVSAAKAIFDEASAILGYDLLERCVHGPKEVLDSTEVAPAAMLWDLVSENTLLFASPMLFRSKMD